MVVIDATHELSLTSEQRRVVDCDAPAVLVKAAAGTGKTEILARKVERFINDPSNGYAHVMAITYTTRAANELKRRLQDRIGDLPSRVTAQTIHGFTHSMLLQHGTHVGLPLDFQVLTNTEDQVELFERYNDSNLYTDYREVLWQLNLARAKVENHENLELWRHALDNAGAVDFGEMLTKAYELLQKPAFARLYEKVYGLIIVDEAQNLTEQQYRLLVALAGPSTSTIRPRIPIMLLGDPKQSIIRFAGADNTLIDRFATEFNAKEFVLQRNFRSARKLAILARDIAKNLEKKTTNGDSEYEYPAPGYIEFHKFPDEKSEGDYIADWVETSLGDGLPRKALTDETGHVRPEEIAVLARNSSALFHTNKALKSRGCETALVYSDKDFMATDLGRIAIMLMRRHSKLHKIAARWDLRRKFSLDRDFASENEIVQALQTSPGEQHRYILIPLLYAASPHDMVSAIKECHLPENGALDALLAGWYSDQNFISETWQEFANVTPVADRSWTRFALHMDRSMRGRDLGPGVRLLTVHKAQGREFKAVAVIGMNDGQFPDFRAVSEADKTAELNTFYVAVTRASRVLLFTRSLKRATRYGPHRTEPSPDLEYVKAAAT